MLMRLLRVGFCVCLALCLAAVSAQPVYAQQQSAFSLQVTPSPLIATLEPGVVKALEFKVLNSGSTEEQYSIALREFTINSDSGEIELGDTEPKDVASFITIEQPEFRLRPNEWFTARLKADTPKEAGFSYSFAVVISRSEQTQLPATAKLQGSVAIFTLLNVDRPDAVRKLDLTEFISAKKVYSSVPASFKLSFKNSGNTLVQPKGNVFISRNDKDPEPITVLPVNAAAGYIIPGSKRTLETQWESGFPSKDADGHERWDWSRLADFRIGRYTAKVVAVYDDGQRDVPIEAALTFWVLPWKIIVLSALLILLVLTGVWTVIKKIVRGVKPQKRRADT